MTAETEAAYRAWLADAHRPAHGRRRASSQAAVLLPHLRPGMRVLDIGCGPGSVTDGLTEFVATEGFVLGVDAATDVLEMANSGETQANFVAADARRVGDWWTSYLSQAPLVDHADALGLATRDELADLASAWREWGSSPAAFSARLWCAAVGWKGDAA